MYFAALLARTDEGWEASDTELDNVETLADLTDVAREASVDDDTVLICIEQENVWFGVVRVDGEDDPRIFVSGAAAAARSAYGEILLTDEMLGREPRAVDDLDSLTDLDGTEDGEPEPDGDLPGSAAETVPEGPVGDAELLADLGMSAEDVVLLSADEAMAQIAEALGCTDVLEAVR
ncbi:tRNA adenosine deaminase-associated protein [Streptomyces sp. GSL17-111]|uniref:tRNA adenosine deaminase-associated protein n=1 Tax=Streptomyces sp. GSL17-111 TaxID=3121596 RepID=UPI0030F4B01C